jgi:hypothetical protein
LKLGRSMDSGRTLDSLEYLICVHWMFALILLWEVVLIQVITLIEITHPLAYLFSHVLPRSDGVLDRERGSLVDLSAFLMAVRSTLMSTNSRESKRLKFTWPARTAAFRSRECSISMNIIPWAIGGTFVLTERHEVQGLSSSWPGQVPVSGSHDNSRHVPVSSLCTSKPPPLPFACLQCADIPQSEARVARVPC